METGNIKEVILGFKKITDNMSAFLDNFEDSTDKVYDAFRSVVEDYVPLKFFAVYDCGYWSEIKIFDTEEQRDDWVTNARRTDEFAADKYRSISSKEFIALSQNGHSYPGNYALDESGTLTFSLR